MDCSDCTAPERWLSVAKFSGLYEVSSRGRIRSIERVDALHHRVRARILKSPVGSAGYSVVGLYRRGVRRQFSVHRLVAEAFIGACPQEHETAHTDGCRTHNCAANLRWATARENERDKVQHGTSCAGERNPSAQLTSKAVIEIRTLCGGGLTQNEAALRYGITKTTVCSILRRRTWRHLQ